MRKLLLAAVAMLTLATPASAWTDRLGRQQPERSESEVTASVGINGLERCHDTRWEYYNPVESTCLTNSGKPIKVIWNGGAGKVDALDDSDQLAVMNLLPSADAPRVWKYSHTPAGQLPACDAAEMIYWLAGSRRPLGAVLGNPTLMGTINGKNMCRANVAGYIVTYSVELMDDGRWWVQRTR